MATPQASNVGPPITNTDVGAGHQSVTASRSVFQGPSYYHPVPLEPTIQQGVAGAGYSLSFTTVGGTAPYTYAVTSGSLPTGLSMSSAGLVSGVPTALGSFTFTVTVTDVNGYTGSQSFTIFVTTPMRVISGYVY